MTAARCIAAKSLALALALALPALGAEQAPAKPDVTSAPAKPLRPEDAQLKERAKDFKLFPGVEKPAPGSRERRPFLPFFRMNLQEGPALETLLWGSGGAIAGSIAGPLGTVVGAGVGAVSGFIVGLVYAPAKKPAAARP